MKYCKDCVFYHDVYGRGEIEECTSPQAKFKYLDIVRGELKAALKSCYFMRMHPNYCGKKARFFKAGLVDQAAAIAFKDAAAAIINQGKAIGNIHEVNHAD